jgi:LSD1 subclass zinc finger protein
MIGAMIEIIVCHGCRRRLQVPGEVVGQDVQCPNCAATFQAVLE